MAVVPSFRRTLRTNQALWDSRERSGEDPLPGTHLPPWAQALLEPAGADLDHHGETSPSLATLLHGGLVHRWRKHREPFQMIALGDAQTFIDTLNWAQDRDQGPWWDVLTLSGTPNDEPVLRWVDRVAAEHHATLVSLPLAWFVPDSGPARLKAQLCSGTRTEQHLPLATHQGWHPDTLPRLDRHPDAPGAGVPGTVPSILVRPRAAQDPDPWPEVVVRWNPIALAVMTRRWDRAHAWSVQAPQAARDAHQLLTTMGHAPGPDRPQDLAGWERWVLTDLSPVPSIDLPRAQARARL